MKPDICAKCESWLDWNHDPMSESGKCETCGEIWYPSEEGEQE